MKLRSISVSDELQILKGCISDRTTLMRVASLGDDVAKFKNKFANTVYKWCIDHLDSYDEAPQRENIISAFTKWQTTAPEELVERVESFLDKVDTTPVNVDLVADKIGTYFSRNSLEELRETIEDDLAVGSIDDAITAVSSWRRVEVGKDASVDVLRDRDAMRDAFEHSTEPLIKYPKAMGRFIGDDFARSSFVAFMGPEKRGKTFAMMDVAWRAMQQKRKVAFIGLGDMTKNQYMKRFGIRAARRPEFAGTYSMPKRVKFKDDTREHEVVEWKKFDYSDNLSWQVASNAMSEIVNRKGIRSPLLKLSAYPNSTMSVDSIEGVLDSWERDGWVPDVIVLDYADLLLAPRGASDERAANNMNWKQLRKISQERHLCMVTATQASAASYDSWVVTKQHFSEDKRKLAHVTGCIGLNMTPEESDDGVMRWNWIVRREAAYNEYDCVLMGGNRGFGVLNACSFFRGEA